MNDFKWEPVSVNHAEELLALWGDSDVIRYTAIPAPCSLEQIRSRIDSLSAFDVFVIRMEGEAMGVVGCIRAGRTVWSFLPAEKDFLGKRACDSRGGAAADENEGKIPVRRFLRGCCCR